MVCKGLGVYNQNLELKEYLLKNKGEESEKGIDHSWT